MIASCARACLFAFVLLSCGGKTDQPQVGGETHWLTRCDSDAECGDLRSCECGRCTVSCANDSSCESFGDEARCLASSELDFAAQCVTAPAALCAREANVTEPESGEEPEPGAEPEPAPGECDQPGREYQCLGESCCAGADVVCPEAGRGFEDDCGCGCLVEPSGEHATLRRFGERFDDSGDCAPGAEIAGVVPYDADCAEEEVDRVAPDGVCWHFNDGCTPEGFTEYDPGVECRPCDATRDVVGRPYDAELGCFADQVVAGTTRAPDACDDAITIALGPDGSCWWFPNTCLPDRFQDASLDLATIPCLSADLCDAAPACGTRSVDGCGDDPRCAVAGGARFDESEACFDEFEPVGCVDSEVACPPVITMGIDANGDCYAFGGCLPAGFVEATPEQACFAAPEVECSP